MKNQNTDIEKNWLTDIVEAAVKAKGESAERYAREKKRDNPTLSQSEIANQAITEDSIWAGLVGIGAGAIAAIPGLGQIIQVAAGVEAIKKVMAKAVEKSSRKFITNVLKGAVLKSLKNILKAVGLKFTKKGLLKKLPFIALVVNPVMNYSDIKLIGLTTKSYLDSIYGKCPFCGHQMSEIGKFCSVCGKKVENE